MTLERAYDVVDKMSAQCVDRNVDVPAIEFDSLEL